jgi:hypothetical protein
MAGSRFPHLPAKIPFGYKELTSALATAIEQSGKIDGATIVDNHTFNEDDIRPFSETVEEGRALWSSLIEQNPANAEKIMKAVVRIFGHEMRLSEITEEQQDLFELLLLEIKTI